MEFKDLKIFQSVAEHGSISRAAVSLNYVQSHITSRIKALEKELNAQLFLRHSKGTTLTSEGVRLQRYTERILNTLSEMEQAFNDTEHPKGRLNIGTVETITKLPNILSVFQTSCPGVSLSVYSDVTKNITEKVVNKTLDCAFVAGFESHVSINKIELFQEKLVLISNKKNMSIGDLKYQPKLVFKKGCHYRRNLEKWLTDEGVTNESLVEFGTLETIIGSVKSGLGTSLVPESTVKRSLDEKEFYAYEVPEKYSLISTDFIWHKNIYLTSAMNQFIQTVQSYKDNEISWNN